MTKLTALSYEGAAKHAARYFWSISGVSPCGEAATVHWGAANSWQLAQECWKAHTTRLDQRQNGVLSNRLRIRRIQAHTYKNNVKATLQFFTVDTPMSDSNSIGRRGHAGILTDPRNSLAINSPMRLENLVVFWPKTPVLLLSKGQVPPNQCCPCLNYSLSFNED